MHQDRQRHFCGFVLGRNILTPVVVVNDLALDLQRELADSATLDSVLTAFFVGFHPVVNHRVLSVALRNSDRTFMPHNVFLRIFVIFGSVSRSVVHIVNLFARYIKMVK